jgi:hypothetical protein
VERPSLDDWTAVRGEKVPRLRSGRQGGCCPRPSSRPKRRRRGVERPSLDNQNGCPWREGPSAALGTTGCCCSPPSSRPKRRRRGVERPSSGDWTAVLRSGPPRELESS